MIKIVESKIDEYIEDPQPITQYPSIKLPDYVYHGTTFDRLDQMAETGVLGKSGEGVYDGVHNEDGFFFDTDPDESVEYAMRGGEVSSDEVVVLEIPTIALNLDQVFLDYNNDEAVDFIEGDSDNPGPAFFYRGVLNDIQSIASIVD